ncbi:hypothetical protein ABW20_dc0102817 [Dactylellina cionopaga]|nr:hypothetical protein ABW20_dc0102817 [Dactylellina cionopaga]
MMAIAALMSGFFLLLALVLWPGEITKYQIILQAPFYLWLTIFTLQPHKEERFMFPAYPALCINAALSMYWLKHLVSHISNKLRAGPSNDFLGTAVISAILLVAGLISASRITAVTTAYSAPKDIYSANRNVTLTGNVCFGKEWYRFPSSYFLPDAAQPRFIKSAFAGLLPGAFLEGDGPYRDGTWVIPDNMNDINQEDYTKYLPKISRRIANALLKQSFVAASMAF